MWTQSFWLEITSRLGEHLETIIITTNITITIIVIIITAYKSYNGRVGSPLHQSHWFNPRGWPKRYTCFARSALCTGNLHDLCALVIIITRPKDHCLSLTGAQTDLFEKVIIFHHLYVKVRIKCVKQTDTRKKTIVFAVTYFRYIQTGKYHHQ